MGQYKMFFSKYKVERIEQYMVLLHTFKMCFWENIVLTMGQLTMFCRNINVNIGHYKMFGWKYKFDRIGQYMVLLHAKNVFFVTIMSEYGTFQDVL